MHITDMLDTSVLEAMLEEGYIRKQVHPDLGYVIYNYTEKTQFENNWNHVSTVCRGLIVNPEGLVLGRPLAKFFNYGQPGAPEIGLDEWVQVTDKMDGSLGILYPEFDQDGKVESHGVATRGSFASEQAVHATKIWKSRYHEVPLIAGLTYLFEIIFPENRIVLDYGDSDDLHLLGAVEIETGQYWSVEEIPQRYWPGPRARSFGQMSFAKALAMEPRPNAEGIVVHSHYSEAMVKIKQEDYVALHKLIFGLNARAIWERIGAGDTVAQICDGLPDEFHPWVQEIGEELIVKQEQLYRKTRDLHSQILHTLPEGWTRKDYAMEALKSDLRPWLFLLLDGRDCRPEIWKSLRPSAERSLVSTSEDTA